MTSNSGGRARFICDGLGVKVEDFFSRSGLVDVVDVGEPTSVDCGDERLEKNCIFM